MSTLRVSARTIGLDAPPFVIAEMSGNHNQSLERALAIVDAAAQAGAHAVKIQTYTADTMTLDLTQGEFLIDDQESPWRGKSLHALYREAYTPWEWHEEIFERCRRHGIIGFSTPFDESAVEFLETLGVPLYKVASFENTDLPLVRRIARTGKPMLISTGMATVGELEETVQAARDAGCRELVLLKCTSSYPAPAEECNILTIPHMRTLFDVEVGLSDHTLGVGVAVGAVALGAVAIEKHFTLRRADGGVDSSFSLEPGEMGTLVSESERVWRALGRVSYGPTKREEASLQFRRSIYVARDVNAGERFTRENVRVIRPGRGLRAKHLDLILGKQARRDAKRGTPLTWDLIGE